MSININNIQKLVMEQLRSQVSLTLCFNQRTNNKLAFLFNRLVYFFVQPLPQKDFIGAKYNLTAVSVQHNGYFLTVCVFLLLCSAYQIKLNIGKNNLWEKIVSRVVCSLDKMFPGCWRHMGH